MPVFVVINEQGPGSDKRHQMREQTGWNEHAVFMDALGSEHFVILGGPLRNYSKHRAMLVVKASDEKATWERLGQDPWMKTGVLRTIEFYPWEILLGKLELKHPGSFCMKTFEPT